MSRFYGVTVEEGIINFYDSLSEKNKRRYAAVEVLIQIPNSIVEVNEISLWLKLELFGTVRFEN